MNKNKMVAIILAVLLILLLAYALFSRNDSLKNIKKLTDEIGHKVDTLTIIQNKYDSLSVRYNDVYAKLSSTSSKLKDFKNQLDSVSHMRIRNVSTITQVLKDLVDQSDEIVEIDTAKTEFRFQ